MSAGPTPSPKTKAAVPDGVSALDFCMFNAHDRPGHICLVFACVRLWMNLELDALNLEMEPTRTACHTPESVLRHENFQKDADDDAQGGIQSVQVCEGGRCVERS